MNITLKIKDISYGDAAVRLMPVLRDNIPISDDAVGKMIQSVMTIPEDIIRCTVDAIPMEKKNEIISLLVAENREKIIAAAEQFLRQHAIELAVTDVQLTKQLELNISVEKINYMSLWDKFFPILTQMNIVQEKPASVILLGLLKLPSFLLRTTIAGMPQEKKDDVVIYLVNRNHERILEKLMDMAAKTSVELHLENLTVSM